MNISNLFVIEDGVVKISNEARNIECLNKIIRKDVGTPTNVDGKTIRVKKKSVKQLAFIYYYLDENSFDNYEHDERIKVICKRIDLEEEGLETIVWDAINELKEDFVTLNDKLLKDFEGTLHSYSGMLSEINLQEKRNLEILKKDISTEGLTKAQIDVIIAQKDEIIERTKANLKWILDASNQLKTTFQNIVELKIKKKSSARKVKQDKLQTDRSFYTRRHV